MIRATLIAIVMIAAACASAATELPSSFVSIAGPCYEHDVLSEKLQADGFNLIATAQSVNATGIEVAVKFYKLDDKIIVALESERRICVIVTGTDLQFGI